MNLTTIRRVAAMLAALLPLTMLAPTGAGLAASTGEATEHVVVFEEQQLPADLESRVRALNGSVGKQFGQIGVATVRGLDDASGVVRQLPWMWFSASSPWSVTSSSQRRTTVVTPRAG